MEIIIEPLLTEFDENILHNLAHDVSREFEHIRVRASSAATDTVVSSLKKDGVFQSSFDTRRNQWNSPKLLDSFYEKFKPEKDKIVLLILDVDAYSGGLNFVLGEALPKAGLGVVYLPRIKEEFYGQKPNDKLFYDRIVKECVHELGHLFNFNHCPNTLCVMHFSKSLSDTDVKGKSFCDRCRMK
jgi:archaemetzincin